MCDGVDQSAQFIYPCGAGKKLCVNKHALELRKPKPYVLGSSGSETLLLVLTHRCFD